MPRCERLDKEKTKLERGKEITLHHKSLPGN